MSLVSRLAGGTLLGVVIGAVVGLVSSTWLGSPSSMGSGAFSGAGIGFVLTLMNEWWGPPPGAGVPKKRDASRHDASDPT
ncbi:hypothetical protein N802_09535 [Knoellia sinensis KCTC 19936]|uniref:Uncharacterized protein n=1 Tax=Knoellia sinensis KCTC 19936 TaxID=1385520 RepID=A0A0A0J0H1_9MICO|nr:hypothetical protein [Knoellia sinensis]KGN30234.1 hypothetical protein N802_09535 [Knoellia sinensis KCTC 19936]